VSAAMMAPIGERRKALLGLSELVEGGPDLCGLLVGWF